MANELTLFDLSDYAAAQIAVYPEMLAIEHFEPNFEQDLATIVEQYDDQALSREIRVYRHKVMVWIIHQDILLQNPLYTCQLLSDFADACVRAIVRYVAGNDLIAVAFGKLGGRELNFSSDIDLMFVGNSKNHAKLIVNIVKLLAEKTAYGFVFRVDLRLRPYGSSGPLVMSVKQCLKYYQKQGRDWERYAWVKARVITGDASLLNPVQQFIYRPYIDFSLLEGLRLIQKHILKEAGEKNCANHIKLGAGGIRELEFIVQSVQIIYGGKHQSLRQNGFINAVNACAKLGLLAQSERLKAHYIFLRDCENKLQMIADCQTHRVPTDPIQFARIARNMGLKPSELKEKLELIRREVSIVFQQLVFHSRETSHAHLDTSVSILSDSKRFEDFWHVIQKRKPYVDLLRENRGIVQSLKGYFQHSQYVFNQFKAHPFLLEVLLHPKVDFTRDTLLSDLQRRLSECSQSDIESKMDVLREFKLETEMHIALCDIAGNLPVMKVSDALTFLAEVILEVVLRQVKTDLDFIIVAYGKLGGLELSYTSDLDLVFIYESAEQKAAVRQAQKLLSWLQIRTYRGALYEIDLRLRPSGASGMLVSSLGAFEQYQLHSAQIWEHQALLRARAVAGTESLSIQFEKLRKHVLTQKREVAKVTQSVQEMRAKIKAQLNQGDIKSQLVDIEFEVQLLVLLNAHAYPALVDFPDNIRILEMAAHVGLMTVDVAKRMIQQYRDIRRHHHHWVLGLDIQHNKP